MRVYLLLAGISLAVCACGADDLTTSGGAGATGSGATGSGATGAGATGSGATGSGAGGGSSAAGGACTGDAVCVAAAPTGWEGPFSVLVAPADAQPTCGSGYELAHHYDAGDVDGDVTCTMCACGAVVGTQCADLQVDAYSGTSCSGSANTLTFGSQACLSTGFVSPYAHAVEAAVPTVSGQPSCPSSGGVVSKAPVTWTEQVVICGPTSAAGCSNGGVCMPPAPAGFPEVACITHEGAADCPAAFSVKSTAYAGFEDTRDCSACDCQPPAATCSADVKAFLGAGCTGGSTTVTADGASCPLIGVGIPGWQSVQVTQTLGAATCTAGGGSPLGEVTPADEVTVCCAAAGG